MAKPKEIRSGFTAEITLDGEAAELANLEVTTTTKPAKKDKQKRTEPSHTSKDPSEPQASSLQVSSSD